MKEIVRGDIIYVDLGQHPKSSVQSGVCPCIVISNDKNNQHFETLNVCPFTKKKDKKHIPVHVRVRPEEVRGFFQVESTFKPEQIVTVDKRYIVCKVGHIDGDSEIMERINRAMKRQFGVDKEGK